jgi:hypothetical protein
LQQKRGERSRPTMCEWFWRVWWAKRLRRAFSVVVL